MKLDKGVGKKLPNQETGRATGRNKEVSSRKTQFEFVPSSKTSLRKSKSPIMTSKKPERGGNKTSRLHYQHLLTLCENYNEGSYENGHEECEYEDGFRYDINIVDEMESVKRRVEEAIFRKKEFWLCKLNESSVNSPSKKFSVDLNVFKSIYDPKKSTQVSETDEHRHLQAKEYFLNRTQEEIYKKENEISESIEGGHKEILSDANEIIFETWAELVGYEPNTNEANECKSLAKKEKKINMMNNLDDVSISLSFNNEVHADCNINVPKTSTVITKRAKDDQITDLDQSMMDSDIQSRITNEASLPSKRESIVDGMRESIDDTPSSLCIPTYNHMPYYFSFNDNHNVNDNGDNRTVPRESSQPQVYFDPSILQ